MSSSRQKLMWQTPSALFTLMGGTDDQIVITDNGDSTVTASLADPMKSPGEIILPHDTYLQGVDAALTGVVDLLKANLADEAEIGASLRVAGLLGDTNPGDRTLYDAPITAASPVGTSHSNALKLNGTTMFRWFTQSDGAGDIQNSAVRLYPAWDDLRVAAKDAFPGGASDPEELAWLTDLLLLCFAPGDELFFEVQVPHDYLLGSNIYMHAHWTPQTRGVAEDTKTVAWKADISSAEVGGVFGATVEIDMTDTCLGTNHEHQVTPSVSIGSFSTVSAMISCRIFRAAGDTWATNTATNCPGLLEVDFHYQRDGIGSENETSKVA